MRFATHPYNSDLEAKALYFRSQISAMADNDDLFAISIVQHKRETEGRPLMGELLPLMLVEAARLSESESLKVMHAWYVLYGATLYLDGLADAGKHLAADDLLRAARVVNRAHVKLSHACDSHETYNDLVAWLSVALDGESLDVRQQSERSGDRSVSDFKKNGVLLAIARLIDGQAKIRIDAEQFSRSLVPVIQALDDYGDMKLDFASQNYTEIVRSIFRAHPAGFTGSYEELVATSLRNGLFSTYLSQIISDLDSVLKAADRIQDERIYVYLQQLLTSMQKAIVVIRDIERRFRFSDLKLDQAIEEFEATIPLVAQST